jgi:DNA-binding NtrC family response regulator
MSLHSILIVDDEKHISAALKRELEEEGYVISTVSSAEEALALLHDSPSKVVISDIKMPGMNGLELLQQVNKSYPEVIRIVLSGHSDIKLILDSVNRYGIDRYLTKPWDIDDLKLTLRQSFELFDLRREVHELRKKVRKSTK